jgi:pleiotropic regulator 1
VSVQSFAMDEDDHEGARVLVKSNSLSTRAFFGPTESAAVGYPPPADPSAAKSNLVVKYADSYRDPVARYARTSKQLETHLQSDEASASLPAVAPEGEASSPSKDLEMKTLKDLEGAIEAAGMGRGDDPRTSQARPLGAGTALLPSSVSANLTDDVVAVQLARDRPRWHAPWKMFRVIMGHTGWVRCVAMDPENQWFATGSADRTIKIWDLASGKLKITLTGHISTVRGVAVSEKHPYMFTVGEDKMVKCWDLEQNKVVRHYHGHLSGVYAVALHPTLDVLMTGGRDAVVRVWDMRTKRQVFALSGHRETVNAIVSQASDPQVISSSVDSTVRLWDLAAGKCMSTLTNHKKGVRALALNPNEFSFASASADNIKTWGLPTGQFMRNLSGHSSLVNSIAVNQDNVLVSGADDGHFRFWDYQAAHCFQTEATKVQPGSLESEAGVYSLSFDRSGSRLISCHGDKTIRVWREDEGATETTHPLTWKPLTANKRY